MRSVDGVAETGWLVERRSDIARSLLYLLRRAEPLTRLHAEVGKPSRARQHHAFERAHAIVECAHAVAERLADVRKMRGECRDAFVELYGRSTDLRGVVRERRLLPAVSDGFQQRDEAC